MQIPPNTEVIYGYLEDIYECLQALLSSQVNNIDIRCMLTLFERICIEEASNNHAFTAVATSIHIWVYLAAL